MNLGKAVSKKLSAKMYSNERRSENCFELFRVPRTKA